MRIAQWVPAFTYGGVETYLARLCRAMVALGHEVTLLTEGGELEPLLDGSGVVLVKLPAGPERMALAVEALRARGCEILNAHNYRAGRWAAEVAPQAGVPWILSIHGPRSLLHRLAHRAWTPLVITTSLGDKQNIAGWFGIAPDRVRVSYQTVDPTVYHPGPPPDAVRAEFAPDGAPLIVHVSRFSNRKSAAALCLLRALPRIRQVVPGTRLLLVGSGPETGAIRALAEQVTAQHGPIARLEPPRLALAELWNLAAVGVATATTALEAMACGAPLIAAGRTGYLGPMTQANFGRGLDLLFADHGRCPARTTPDRMETDVVRVLTAREAARAEAEALAAKVLAEFNPTVVAEHVLGIYEELLAM